MKGLVLFNQFLPTSSITTGFTSSNFITKLYSDSIYQTISAMSSYLTTTSASSLYQTIANMSSYLTTAIASTNYATKIEVSNQINMNARVMLQGPIITSTTHLDFLNGIYEYYMVTVVSANINIYLPAISYDNQCGLKITFKRGYTNNSLNIINFYSDGVGQYVYNQLNQPNATLGIAMFTISFVSMKNSLSPFYSWYQL